MKQIRYIGLIILLLVAGRLAGQGIPVLDTVCAGTDRYYRVDGSAGSTYTWLLTLPGGTTDTLPSDADTLAIAWNYSPGTYLMQVIQHSDSSCDAIPVYGELIILESPDVFAGDNDLVCSDSTYYLAGSWAQNISSLSWTTSGDGIFNDSTLLHPIYTPGNNDILIGSVVLTLTGAGMGAEGGCEPAVSNVTLAILQVEINISALVNVSCYGYNDGFIQLVASGGIEPYTYTLNGESNQTGLFENLYAGDYGYTVFDINGCTTGGNITITEPPPMEALYSFTPATCNGGNNGTITIFDASGGSGTYDYSIDGTNWQTAGFFNGLAPGIYIPQIRDAIVVNCISIIDTIDISEPGMLSATVDYTNVTCFNANDGTITVTDPVGGSGSYEYSITGFPWQSSGLFTGLAPASYEVIIRDLNDPDCEVVLATIDIVEPLAPFVSAGDDAQICSNETYTLSGTTNMGAVGWSTNGTGSFDDTTLLAATYTPSVEDIDSGMVMLTLTAFAGGDCENISDTMALIIWKQVTVFAGSDASICDGDTYQVPDAVATDYAALLWTHDGAGILTGDTTLTPTYIPDTGETGLITLILLATPMGSGTCPEVQDTMTIIITGSPMVNAGVDAPICSTDTYTLSGTSNMTSVLWTTSGTGTFDDQTLLNATYTSSTDDINAGQVILTLTANGNGNCEPASDEMVLTIWKQVTVFAGSDASICEGDAYQVPDAVATDYAELLWTHDGAGILTGDTTLTPTYIPDTGETGLITLILMATPMGSGCPEVQDTMTIIITGAPVVNAGIDGEICSTDTYTLSGTSNMTSVLWTTSGTGTFDDQTLLNATYTPGTDDINAGQVILTLTANGNGSCEPASDEMILTIWKQATVFAGTDASICEGDAYQVPDASATDYAELLWTHDGAGILTRDNTLTPTYIPDTGETGLITLILMATPMGSGCLEVQDTMTIIITGSPVVNAGVDGEICSTDTYTLSGTSNMTSVLWTTSGTGTFDDQTLLNATYTPSTDDINAGQVILTLTANGSGNCEPASDEMVLTIWEKATAYAGNDASICEGDLYQVPDASATGYVSIEWIHNGAGTLTNGTTLSPIYTPAPGETGLVTLIMTAISEGGGLCPDAMDSTMIEITGVPICSAGSDDEICETETYTLSGMVINSSSVLWTTSGTGVFDNANILAPTYTPGQEDVAAGQVTLTLTAFGNGSCGAVSDQMELTIVKLAEVYAGSNDSVCEGDSFQIQGAAASNFVSLLWTHNGLGTLTDETTLSPTYTPGSGETGLITLILSAISLPPCESINDTIILTILPRVEVDAGADATVCEGVTYVIHGATAVNFSELRWSTSGTGSFNDSTIMNPEYTPSIDDISSGGVTLTLTAFGLGNDGTCPPAVSDLVICLSVLTIDATVTNASCPGTPDGSVTMAATNGNEPYEYTLNGNTNNTGYFADMLAGTYNYLISDANGCKAQGIVTIGITDDQAPAINCPAPVVTNTEPGECFSFNPLLGSPSSVTDNCGIDTVFNNFLALFPDGQVPVGSCTITWTVIDNYGNSATCSQLLSVIDNEYPEISCQDINGLAEQGACEGYVTIPTPEVSDNCQIDKVTNSQNGTGDASGIYPVGTNTVVWSVSDIYGNTSTCHFSVTVQSDPVAVDDYASTPDEVPVDIYILGNDKYCESDNGSASATIIRDPEHGLAIMTNAISFLIYQPDNDFIGIDSLEYELCDYTGECDTATVYITVFYYNSPPVAVIDYDSTIVNIPKVVAVLANDYDPDGQIIDFELVTQPMHGTSSKIIADRAILYSPLEDFIGIDEFSYAIYDDGNPSLSSTTKVIMYVLDEDDFPGPPIIIYNALTPNADGKNDFWKLKGIELFPDNQVIIMDRWGTIIAEFEHYDNATVRWEGKNKEGFMVPNGTYYYFISLSDHRLFYKGWVFLYQD
ncbi:MAG: gliding motility-associated C-terminal domain-containing protein [Bacteroidetes bacterium]|nr:gliding motility-associated C-terminal domain-containing protein [Bacteroidota bacterium]